MRTLQNLVTASLTKKLQRRRWSPPMWFPPFGASHPSGGIRSCGSVQNEPPEPPASFAKEVDPEVMRNIQDLIEGLAYNSPAALKELFELSCEQFMKYGQRRSESQKHLEVMEEAFRKKARHIIEHKTDQGPLQDRLLKSLEGCYQSFETLQGRLDDAVNAKYRVDDEEIEGDEHEPIVLKDSKEWHGTEAHPCHQRWVMDAEVVYQNELQRNDGKGRILDVETSILLSNLPDPCEEETVKASLAACGEISHVEICNEWKEMVEATREGPDTIMMQDGELVRKPPPKYSLSYALIEFNEIAGRQRAMRQLCRLQGILINEMRRVKLQKSWTFQTVARPSYPQDLRLKRSLLLRGLPIHMDPAEVLQALLRRLSHARGRLLNCRAFRVRGSGPLQRLEVQVGPDGCDVDQEPPEPSPLSPLGDEAMAETAETLDGRNLRCCPPGNGGEMVLRFKNFQEAYISRERLQAWELGGRRVFVGFPPWRPQAVWSDSRGYDLEEARLLDLPVPPASARYSRELDPVNSAPSIEVVDAWARS